MLTPRRVAVIRNCCTLGNCDKCTQVTPFGTCLIVTQTPEEGVTPEKADIYVKNWYAYKPQIVGITAARRHQARTDKLVSIRRDKISKELDALKHLV